MPERRPRAADRNLLWASSGGRCAFPDCAAALVESVNGTWVTVGEIAHIHAHSRGGARFDPTLAAAAVDTYENCILLCRRHHRMVDDAPKDFAPDRLREWKRQHEARHRPGQLSRPHREPVGAPPPLAHAFVDRDDMHERIAAGVTAAPALTLVGAQGSGKTQVALRYLDRAADRYTFRCWVRGSSRATLTADVAALAALLGIIASADAAVEDVARLVVATLEARPGWLLVLDDVRNTHDLLGLVPSQGGHVLITSANAGWSGLGATVAMPPLSPTQARDLIATAAPTIGDADAAALADLCDFVPIAVAQATSYVAQTGAPPEAFLALLRSHRAELMDRGSAAPHSTLAVSVDRTMAALTSSATALLRVLSLLAPTPFQLQPTGAAPGDEADPFASTLALEDAIGELRGYSLVERDGDSVTAHALIQDIVRLRMCGSVDEAVAAIRAVDAVYAQLPERTGAPEEWPAFEVLTPHAEALREHLRVMPAVPKSAVGYVLNRIGPYYAARGDRGAGAAALREALDQCGPDPVEEHDVALRASLLNNFGNLLRDQGDLLGAAECIEESLRLKEQVHGPDHPLVGIACGALAAVKEAQGNLNGAVALHERALRIHRLAGNARRAAAALLDIAADDLTRGDGDAARARAAEAAALAAAASDGWIEEERAHLTLAEIHGREGRLHDALSSARAGVAAAHRPGIESEFLARALAVEARGLSKLGNPAAIPLFEQALEVHGRTDPHGIATAQAQGDYGVALFVAGRADDGLRQLRESEEWLATHRLASDRVLARGRLMLAHALALAGAGGEAASLLRAVVTECNTAPLVKEAHAALASLDDPL